MRLLLDTRVLLWWLADSPKLRREVRAALGDSVNSVLVSAASGWEISIKKALGKLTAPDDLEGAILRCGFSPLPITLRHAETAGKLPRHHDDPFDRMLIAQASVENLTVATHDTRFRLYDVRVLLN